MKHIHYILLSVLIISGCNLDQIDKHYADYNAILADNYNTKGWLPEKFILPSTTDLYSRTDIDVNSFLIRYSLSQSDLDRLITLLDSVKREFQKPHGVKIPNWWTDSLGSFNTYQFTNETNSWWFAIDYDNSVVYCWGNH